MFHKIQNGDTYKLLPQPSTNGSFSWIREMSCLYTRDNLIYDIDGKWFEKLRGIVYKSRFDTSSNIFNNKVNFSKRYYTNFLDKSGSIKTFQFGKKLHEIITLNADKLMDIKSNWHLNIKMEIRNTYPIYDKTDIIESHWNHPVSDINDKEEWADFLKKNSPNLDSFFRDKDIKYRRNELISIFGNDIISEIISEDRVKKLNEIGL